MFGNKLILSTAITLALTLFNPAFAQRLTGCLDAKGNIGQVQLGEAPLVACTNTETQVGWDQMSAQPMFIIDSSVPPKILAPTLHLHGFTSHALVGFEFEGETYRFHVRPSRTDPQQSTFFPTGDVYFAEPNCQGQAYSLRFQMWDQSLPPLKLSLISPKARNKLWVEGGDPLPSVTVESSVPLFAPGECVQATTTITNAVPLRDSGVNLDTDFTHPFRLSNLPSLP